MGMEQFADLKQVSNEKQERSRNQRHQSRHAAHGTASDQLCEKPRSQFGCVHPSRCPLLFSVHELYGYREWGSHLAFALADVDDPATNFLADEAVPSEKLIRTK